MDLHHVAGKANSPVTISIPVNDHRAVLNTAQYDWPKATLRNCDGSPLLVAAACIRGFCNVVLYLITELLHWIADMLERFNSLLCQRWGKKWWLDVQLIDLWACLT